MQGVGLAPRTLGPEVKEFYSGQPQNVGNSKYINPRPQAPVLNMKVVSRAVRQLSPFTFLFSSSVC